MYKHDQTTLNFFNLLFYVYECFVSMYHQYHVHAWYLRRPEDGIRYHETGVTDSSESACRFLELNPGSLEDQLVFLTTELSSAVRINV